MGAKILNLQEAAEQAFASCRDIIRSGGVIAYPTDTFYGLGADPANRSAVRRIFDIKGRMADQPILLLLGDRAVVGTWASVVTPSAERLMTRFWPGPLTLVFRSRPDVLRELTGGTGTIGLRVPGSGATRELLRHLGGALTGTSANRTGEPASRTAEEVLRAVGDGIELILDGGPAQEQRPSTVIDVTADPPRLIRAGAVDASALLA